MHLYAPLYFIKEQLGERHLKMLGWSLKDDEK